MVERPIRLKRAIHSLRTSSVGDYSLYQDIRPETQNKHKIAMMDLLQLRFKQKLQV
jgi:hypothetical protein